MLIRSHFHLPRNYVRHGKIDWANVVLDLVAGIGIGTIGGTCIVYLLTGG